MKNNGHSLPFEEKLKGIYNYRKFSSELDENELKWHFDEQDRIVVCEHETDWCIQMDNQLPITIQKNVEYFIPEGEYHRIIKGTGDLTVRILKLNAF